MIQDYYERHYTDCPKCGAHASLIPIAQDRYGESLYECTKCKEQTVDAVLRIEARKRRMRD